MKTSNKFTKVLLFMLAVVMATSILTFGVFAEGGSDTNTIATISDFTSTSSDKSKNVTVTSSMFEKMAEDEKFWITFDLTVPGTLPSFGANGQSLLDWNRGNANYEFLLRVFNDSTDANKAILKLRNNEQNYVELAAIEAGKTHTVAICFEKSSDRGYYRPTCTVYLNGEAVGSKATIKFDENKYYDGTATLPEGDTPYIIHINRAGALGFSYNSFKIVDECTHVDNDGNNICDYCGYDPNVIENVGNFTAVSGSSSKNVKVTSSMFKKMAEDEKFWITFDLTVPGTIPSIGSNGQSLLDWNRGNNNYEFLLRIFNDASDSSKALLKIRNNEEKYIELTTVEAGKTYNIALCIEKTSVNGYRRPTCVIYVNGEAVGSKATIKFDENKYYEDLTTLPEGDTPYIIHINRAGLLGFSYNNFNIVDECAHKDTDNDKTCDICGESLKVVCTEHKDENKDKICDVCGESLKIVCTEHKDEDKNKLCDVCDEPFIAECNDHIDEDGDKVCDYCGYDFNVIASVADFTATSSDLSRSLTITSSMFTKMVDDERFWITFDVTVPQTITKYNGNKSLLDWQTKEYEFLLRVFDNEDSSKADLKIRKADKSTYLDLKTIEAGQTYSIAICVEGTATNDKYNYQTPVCSVYINGEFVGKTAVAFDTSKYADGTATLPEGDTPYKIHINRQTGAGFAYKNFKIIDECVHKDTDNDKICDICGESLKVVCTEHKDIDKDNLCDVCGKDLNLISDIGDFVSASNSMSTSVTTSMFKEMISDNDGKFYLTFELTTPATMPTNLGTNGQSMVDWQIPDNIMWLRLFNGADNTSAVLKMRNIEEKFVNDFTIYANQAYKVDICVEPLYNETNGYHRCYYSVYVDGKLLGRERIRFDDNKKSLNLDSFGDDETLFTICFNRGNMNGFAYNGIKILHDPIVVKCEHADCDESIAYVVGDNGVDFVINAVCKDCGETQVLRAAKALVSSIPVIYDGYEKIEIDVPEERWVINTDVNLREAVSGALITLGGVSVLDVPADIVLPTTISVAVVVDGNSYETYVDGKLVNNGELGTDLNKVVFGKLDYGAYVRFSHNRIASYGVTETPVAVNSPTHPDAKTCYHTMPMYVANKVYYADGELKAVYICEECGERIYSALEDNMVTNITGWAQNSGNTDAVKVYTNLYDTSNVSAPYWISFDVTPMELPNPTETGRYNRGYGLVTVYLMDGEYNAQLRIIADGWENADGCDVENGVRGTTDGKAGIYLFKANNEYRTAAKVASIEKDVKVNFALYVDPASGNYDVYVGGKYVASGSTGIANTNLAADKAYIRIGEAGAGKYLYQNIQVVRDTVSYNDRVTVIETEATFTQTSDVAGVYEPLVTINREEKSLDLIYVDACTGQLVYKVNETDYVLLVDRDGEPLVLTEEITKLSIVYDDIRGMVRCFVDGTLPYADNGESVEILGNVNVYDKSFTEISSTSDKLACRVVISDKKMKTNAVIKSVYGINGTGTAEIVGYQEHDITNSIRFVAGVDTPYYNEIGYDITVYDAEGNDVTNKNETNTERFGGLIYSAVTANDKYLYAGRYGYEYFSALAINDIKNAVGYTIEVIPYTKVGGVKLSGVPAKVEVTEDGYRFVELGNGVSVLPNDNLPGLVGLDKVVGLRKAQTVEALADAYVSRGSSTQNMGGENYIATRYSSNGRNTLKSFIKFDISGINVSDNTVINLKLNCIKADMADFPLGINVYSISDNSWDEFTITYNNAHDRDRLSSPIGSAIVERTGVIHIDVTDYVKTAKNNGDAYITLSLESDGLKSRYLNFASKEYEGGGGPALMVTVNGEEYSTILNYSGENPWDVAMENVNEWLARWDEIKDGGDTNVELIEKIDSEYSITVGATLDATDSISSYTKYPTRTISSLDGFSASVNNTVEYDVYGGIMDESMKQDATGFFYTAKIGDRWWTIDPLGYPFYRTALVSIDLGSTAQKTVMLSKYGSSVSKWAQGTTDRLRELGFNSVGGWSEVDYLSAVNKPLTQTKILNVLSKYAEKQNLSEGNSGSTTLVHNVMPVFDPAFVESAEKTVREGVAGYANASFVYGWMSDNELPKALNMLDSALKLDPNDERFAYTYATAWTFLVLKTGKTEPTLADVTDEMRVEYRAMVYDRYFKVVSNALDKYAPNQQYIGCRFVRECFIDEAIMRVAGYWCDVVSINYYYAWEGEPEVLANMQAWAGKPFIVTEWYAKGMDACTDESGLTNESGGGWTVATQNDRGLFYENFALQLLECKGCVGFDWFKYLDNDPTDTTADSSNRDANKGIIDNNGNEYSDLINHISTLNNKTYDLISFFDARNANN